MKKRKASKENQAQTGEPVSEIGVEEKEETPGDAVSLAGEESLDDETSELGEAEETRPEELSPEEAWKAREAELRDQLQRLAAEFENYKKKNAGEFFRGKEAGGAQVSEALLPVLDSIAAALASVNGEHSVDSLLEGVRAVQRQTLEKMKPLGLEIIPVATGDKLDPEIHDVLCTQESDSMEAGKVMTVVQDGYKFNGKLLRPAKVIVVKEGAE